MNHVTVLLLTLGIGTSLQAMELQKGEQAATESKMAALSCAQLPINTPSLPVIYSWQMPVLDSNADIYEVVNLKAAQNHPSIKTFFSMLPEEFIKQVQENNVAAKPNMDKLSLALRIKLIEYIALEQVLLQTPVFKQLITQDKLRLVANAIKSKLATYELLEAITPELHQQITEDLAEYFLGKIDTQELTYVSNVLNLPRSVRQPIQQPQAADHDCCIS